MWGIKRFKLYLAGKRSTFLTDKPLKYLKDADYQNDRVEDIPMKENVAADFWSRVLIYVLVFTPFDNMLFVYGSGHTKWGQKRPKG